MFSVYGAPPHLPPLNKKYLIIQQCSTAVSNKHKNLPQNSSLDPPLPHLSCPLTSGEMLIHNASLAEFIVSSVFNLLPDLQYHTTWWEVGCEKIYLCQAFFNHFLNFPKPMGGQHCDNGILIFHIGT